MAKAPARKIAFISSYPPRQCGIATFACDLIKNVRNAAGRAFEPLIVAMQEGNHQYSDPVKFEIRSSVKNDYISAADYINFSHVDASVQRRAFSAECRLAPEPPAAAARCPIITTMHTVLEEPTGLL